MNRIVSLMIERRMITEDDGELYLYGLQLLSEKLAGLCCLLLICVISGRLVQGAVFYIAYSLLRKYAGGYHADNFVSCLISSSLTMLACCLLCKLSFAPLLSVLMTMLCAPAVFFLAPAQHNEKPLDDCEIRRYRKLTRVFLFAESCAFVVLFAVGFYSLCFSIGFAFFMLSILLLAQTLINKKHNLL